MERIQVYADEETKRRVEVAALKRRTSVTEDCLGAIRERLAEDDLLDTSHVEIALTRSDDDAVMIAIRSLRRAILEDRHGEPVDVDAVIDEVREERSDAILGLR